MYIQKLLKANKSVPRSRNWSWDSRPPSIPQRAEQITRIVTAARVPRNMPEKLYTPKTVLDHFGSRDMIQSVLANQQVKAKSTRKAAEMRVFPAETACCRVERTTREVMASKRAR